MSTARHPLGQRALRASVFRNTKQSPWQLLLHLTGFSPSQGEAAGREEQPHFL